LPVSETWRDCSSPPQLHRRARKRYRGFTVIVHKPRQFRHRRDSSFSSSSLQIQVK
ncbi:hypothetical protein HN51_070034, partial [Arachis hypogaea]